MDFNPPSRKASGSGIHIICIVFLLFISCPVFFNEVKFIVFNKIK